MSSPTIELTPERWALVDRLFHEASELSDDQRLDFLQTECPDDEELRDYLVDLLQVDPESALPIDTIVAETMNEAFAEIQPDTLYGERIGPYRIERLLGAGGMGMVYLASRADDHFDQDVAIKLGRHRLVDPQTELRLRTERQILSDLDHPNIARLFDGGMTSDGVPYLVMEYINGVRIDTYCDLHRLTIRQRLVIFQSICRAVHFAHQNLVVHRDIKAANILVAADGTAKLLDFGIAKLIDTGDAQAAGLTQEGAVVMTPANAAPEQVLGNPVTTATDVYMLGLLLYDLLTGFKAFDPDGRTAAEFADIICQQEVTAPSVRLRRAERRYSKSDGTDGIQAITSIAQNRSASPEKLQRELRGDLDTIVAKALRKDPNRRYRSVNALADDIDLHLNSMPITARSESWQYRAGKFVRRHFAAVALSVVAFLVLAGFAVALSIQNRIVIQERDTAREVSQFLEEVFMAQDPSQRRGANVTADEILAAGAARIQEDLTARPEIQSALMGTIGRVYFNLGVYDRSSELLQRALQQQQNLGGRNDARIAALQNDLAEALIQIPDYAQAEALLDDALESNTARAGAQSLETAENLFNLAELHLKTGELDDAESFAQASVDAYSHQGAEHGIEYADAKNMLARIYQVREELDKAESLLLEAIDILIEAEGADHPWMAYYLQNLGVLQQSKGDLDAAEATFRDALATTRRIFGSDHRLFAGILRDQGRLLLARGDHSAAEGVLRDSLRIYSATLGDGHPLVGYGLTLLGVVQHDSGKLLQAENSLRQAVDIFESVYDSMHQNTASALNELGAVLISSGRDAESIPFLQRALEARRRDYAPDSDFVLITQLRLADALLTVGRLDDAKPLIEYSVRVLATRPESDSYDEAKRLEQRALELKSR